ncbi:MAG: hypothetical protein ACI4PF_04805 [Christensenellales bacterium]
MTHDLMEAVNLADKIIILKTSSGIYKEITNINNETEQELLKILKEK